MSCCQDRNINRYLIFCVSLLFFLRLSLRHLRRSCHVPSPEGAGLFDKALRSHYRHGASPHQGAGRRPKPRFYFCELLWFWKWRCFLNFYPMKTISSRKSEVKSQVGHRTVRFGMSPSRRVQRAIATYVLEWPIPKSNFEPKIPCLGLRPAKLCWSCRTTCPSSG
jgi:hypothetical protein